MKLMGLRIHYPKRRTTTPSAHMVGAKDWYIPTECLVLDQLLIRHCRHADLVEKKGRLPTGNRPFFYA